MDPTTTEAIERVERNIAAIHPHHRPFNSEIRPHITLGACTHLDVTRCTVLLDEYAAMSSSMPLHFGSLGIFPLDPAVIFAAPVVTDELLAGHAWFHQRFAEISGRSSVSYEPGNWVPHCTLAEQIPQSLLPEMVAVVCTLPLSLNFQIDLIHLAEFPAGRILHSAKLQ